jgi:hypothetical protein
LLTVSNHVRDWLWAQKCDACGENQFSVDDEWTCESCEKAKSAEQ